jgi:hypothetical protein
MRLFQASACPLDEVKIEVPSMGDSITEGVISELHKKVGVHCTGFTGCCKQR